MIVDYLECPWTELFLLPQAFSFFNKSDMLFTETTIKKNKTPLSRVISSGMHLKI